MISDDDSFEPIDNVPAPEPVPQPQDPKLEFGTVEIDHEWATVELQHEYDDPVVIVGPATYVGTQPITLRVKDVKSKSF